MKKLEYQNKQSVSDLQTLQQALTSEALKRQETRQDALEKEEKINDLLSDVKQLSEEMVIKEDEVMLAYQKYKKELKEKDKELDNLK